jgi:hypothetical protein
MTRLTANRRIGAGSDEPSFGRQVVEMAAASRGHAAPEIGPEERKGAHSDVGALSTAAGQRRSRPEGEGSA